MKLEPNPRNLKENLSEMRDMGTEGIYYGGYGYATFHFAEAFRALDWDPPRVMGTAFMFYSNSNEWAEGLEGWHGVDQLGEDGTNPNYEAMVQALRGALRPRDPQRRRRARLRHRARRDPRDRERQDPDAAGRPRRARADPVDAGRRTAGPSRYVQFGPGDHKGYKGDFLTIRELRGGELRFDGYYRPEWPSNQEASS